MCVHKQTTDSRAGGQILGDEAAKAGLQLLVKSFHLTVGLG